MSGTAARGLSLTVTRYTPQAVLVANVEEARYDALLSEDGKRLVRARYAVRNNQRSFLGITLPSLSSLWSASLGGRPVRPGLAADGGLLLPLQKGRAGEEAPSFIVELVYLQRATAWSEKGDAHVELPTVDLPVSRTGLTLHYSPRYEVDITPGTFRVTTDPGPWTGVLRAGVERYPLSAPAPRSELADQDAARELRGLVDMFNRDAGRARQGAVPIAIDFIRMGPSIFLAAELTAESRPASLDVAYRRTGGR
jgi:hypothetical protein